MIDKTTLKPIQNQSSSFPKVAVVTKTKRNKNGNGTVRNLKKKNSLALSLKSVIENPIPSLVPIVASDVVYLESS